MEKGGCGERGEREGLRDTKRKNDKDKIRERHIETERYGDVDRVTDQDRERQRETENILIFEDILLESQIASR